MKICVEQWWNGTDREKTEALGEKPVPVYSVHLKCHIEQADIEPTPPG